MSGTEEQNLNIQPGAEQAGSQSGTDNNAQIESLRADFRTAKRGGKIPHKRKRQRNCRRTVKDSARGICKNKERKSSCKTSGITGQSRLHKVRSCRQCNPRGL